MLEIGVTALQELGDLSVALLRLKKERLGPEMGTSLEMIVECGDHRSFSTTGKSRNGEAERLETIGRRGECVCQSICGREGGAVRREVTGLASKAGRVKKAVVRLTQMFNQTPFLEMTRLAMGPDTQH